MKSGKSSLFLTGLVMLLLSACGSGGGANGTHSGTKLAEANSCIGTNGCHSTSVSPGTGNLIVEEWKISGHNVSNGAGCRDCHQQSARHTCDRCHGGGMTVTGNPDNNQRCYNCHGTSFPNDAMIAEAPQHFGNMTTSINNNKYRAQYVSSMYVGNCRKCHNPHLPIARDSGGKSIHEQWAASGMGQTTAPTRGTTGTGYDFKTRGTYQPPNTTLELYCVRCHTTTGFINFVTSGFTDLRPFAGPGYPVVQTTPKTTVASPDKSKEVTACNACHDNGNGVGYGYQLRAVPPLVVYYNISTTRPGSLTRLRLTNIPRSYPDLAASNMCVPCHTGRGVGQLIYDAMTAIDPVKGTTVSFRDLSRISAHDFTGAGTVTAKSGYEYLGRNYDSVSSGFLHGQIGMNNFKGTGSRGPCITCHMRSAESHSFLPVEFDESTHAITSIKSQVCATCHNGSLKPAWSVASLQAKKSGFRATLALLYRLMGTRTPAVASSTTNWFALYSTSSGPAISKQQHGANTMGAYFNYDVYKNDWGAYAHNDLYVKRLLYDSIDWIANGKLDDDVEAALTAVVLPATVNDPVTGKPFSATDTTNLKTDAVQWLLNGPGGTRP